MGLSYYPKVRRVPSGIRFCAIILLFCASELFSQSTLLETFISIPRQNTTLYEALDQISQKAGCFFIYDSESVRSDRRVRLYAGNQPLEKVLDNLLVHSGLRYKVLGKHILIFRAAPEPVSQGSVVPTVSSADSARHFLVSGYVKDIHNRNPIPFATLGITEENIGTVTNNDGFFTLKIPESLVGTSLIVSHLGYLSKSIPVQLLDRQQIDIYLDRRVISIPEVIIRYIDPLVILEQAMERRKMNNALAPVYLTSFYREGVKKNNEYISYSEAVFKVFKSPFDQGAHADQVKLLKSRKVQEEDPGDTVFLKLKGGVQSALQLDIVKSIPGFLDLAEPLEYTFRYGGLVSYDEKDAYAVTFVQKEGLDKALYTGTVYIEKEQFAVLGAEFEINPDYLELAAEDLVLRKSQKLIVRLDKIRYSVRYIPFNGRYYLGHVRCDLQVRTRLRHRLSFDDFTTFLEFATCRIDTTGVVKFPKQQILKPTVVFSDQPYISNDAFWGGYNIIPPEASLIESLSKIIGKIEEVEE
jgi:hypothetical protein